MPTAAEEVLAPAIEAHKEGRLDDAAAVYRQVLATEPDHADALHLLGVVMHQMSRNDEARPLIERAIEVRPGVAHYHNPHFPDDLVIWRPSARILV